MAQNYGFQAQGEFSVPYEAALRRLRGDFARRHEQLAQATSGMRGSGVALLPRETLERGQSEAEAGLIGDFAFRQADEAIMDRRRGEDFAHGEKMARMGYDLQDAIARRLAGQQLKGQLIGGGLGAIGGYLTRR